MSEPILAAILNLFAIITTSYKIEISKQVKDLIRNYLSPRLSQIKLNEYLLLFDEFVDFYNLNTKTSPQKSEEERISTLCQNLNKGLQLKEKFIIIIRLTYLLKEQKGKDLNIYGILNLVADALNVESEVSNKLFKFIENELENEDIEESVIIIRKERNPKSKLVQLIDNNLSGEIKFLYLESIQTLIFEYSGNEEFDLNGHFLEPGIIYFFEAGSIIRGQIINPIYHTYIISKFRELTSYSPITFEAENIEFKFPNSENGVHEISFSESSGQLIGIMGGSGSGKTTLLNILNGNLPLTKGSLYINGIKFPDDSSELRKIIGFIPQDDLLIEELTVFQNLYYNAKLCFKDLSQMQLLRKVIKTLEDLELNEIKHLKVGSPIKKVISGGQRKRLNIALELIREPSILFVDEPTSGLSSSDSEKVMLLLKEQTLTGKLIFTNIHQPSSDIFRLFDKLYLMDKGGYLIYSGNPMDAGTYFKHLINHVNPDESECLTCGYINPEQILKIIDSKVINEHGVFSKRRKFLPEEWYNLYKENIESKTHILIEKIDIPKTAFSIQNKFKQFEIYFVRNLLSKISDKQYVLLNLLEIPILAFILGFLTKNLRHEDYIFSENNNIPAYIFMCVIVALFIGLTVSAEEIIKDRQLLKRESFLRLSRMSYINSKVFYLLVLSVIQSFFFIIIGNTFLEIKGMFFSYWIVFFSAAFCANMIGLNISAALNSVVAIYILIPFILVPQLILSGALMRFEDLNESVGSKKYVPIIGDVMISRWAYEALAVNQFKNNKYEREFYYYNQEIQNASFKTRFLIPQLKNKLDFVARSISDPSLNIGSEIELLNNELTKLNIIQESNFALSIENLNKNAIEKLHGKLDSTSEYHRRLSTKMNQQKDVIIQHIADENGGKEYLIRLQNEHFNNKLSNLLLNRAETTKILQTDHEFISTMSPVYRLPESTKGRAHMYSGVKRLGSLTIDTFWFNLSIIWLFTLLLYLALRFNLLKYFLQLFSKNQL